MNRLDPSVEIILSEAIRDRMYGSIEIKLENGRVVLIKRTETIKPTDSRANRDAERG